MEGAGPTARRLVISRRRFLGAVLVAPAALLAAPEASAFEPWWVANFEPTDLWSGPDANAVSFRRVPQFRRFLVVQPQEGDRLYVWDPRTQNYAWIDAADVGPTGPSVWADLQPPVEVGPVGLPARTVAPAVVYEHPLAHEELRLDELPHNRPVNDAVAVEGQNGERWYRVPEGYVPASALRFPRSPTTTFPGRWIDADLREPCLVTAYEGARAVYAALAVKGSRVHSTPTGVFHIVRRVANETMDSETIGIPRNSRGGYYLRNVLFTQYFTWNGHSLHYNWWRANFGYAGSHGCLGLTYADARFFWDWAGLGTPLVIRS